MLFLAQNPAEARILIVESSGLSPRLEQIRRSIIASHSRSAESTLRALAPTLPVLKPGITVRCWTGAAYEAVHSWLELLREKHPSAKVVARAVARFNLQGIGATP